MKPRAWTLVWCLALLIGGCAKRQSSPRLVYVPAPPPVTSAAPPPSSGTLLIEEPTPPEPVVAEPADEAPLPATEPRSRPQKPRQPEASPERAGAEQPPAKPSAVDVPPLVLAINPGQADLQKVEKTQQDVGQRISQFERRSLSEAEQRTLAEAKAFLDQSTRALKDGDLQRAERLAYKASLLITAFEQQH